MKKKKSRKTKCTENMPNPSLQNSLILKIPRKKSVAIQILQNLSLPVVVLHFSIMFTGPLEAVDKPLIVHNPKFV